MKVEQLINIINADFFTGVPDSQLKALCDYLIQRYGISEKHIIAANEGNCAALAAGYYLATGKIPVVYMQNSGIGNAVNPIASLLNDKVYGIPCIFIIGWRGEPGIHDEPQHIFQGEITLKLLEDLDVNTCVINKETTEQELINKMKDFSEELKKGKSVAFVVKKGALTYDGKITYNNKNNIVREDIIKHIVQYSQEDIIVSTTGKASRELFEIRENNKQGHQYDFLTVGSMGHSSSIALGVALNKPDKKVWCIDGDGAMLMHMGALAVIGNKKPKNLIHIIINNGAHETVGGMPTVSNTMDICSIALGCGYLNAVSVDSLEAFDKELELAKKQDGLALIEVKASIGARDNLGRPTTSAKENKEKFMEYLGF